MQEARTKYTFEIWPWVFPQRGNLTFQPGCGRVNPPVSLMITNLLPQPVINEEMQQICMSGHRSFDNQITKENYSTFHAEQCITQNLNIIHLGTTSYTAVLQLLKLMTLAVLYTSF